MNNQFIKPLTHVSKEPVSVVREHPDRLVIEGVRYDGDYFRTFGAPETDVLYAVRRDAEGCVRLTVIDSLEKAMYFFEEIAAGDCPSTALRSVQDEGE
jgi:hypothetical protein